MKFDYRVPGVYREELVVQAEPALPTGVPGFVGFADERAGGETPAFNVPVELHRKDEFDAKFVARADGYLEAAVAGFFENGGRHCYVVRAETVEESDAERRAASLAAALDALAPVQDLDLVAVPDAMALRMSTGDLDPGAVVLMQQAVLAHCERHGGRLAILDSLPGADARAVRQQRADLALGVGEPVNGALYYPWLQVAPVDSTFPGLKQSQPNAGAVRVVPPCGHVAGIYARTDEKVGVYKAPANEEIRGVIDLETAVDDSVQDLLNPEGVNCLRAFRGRGIRVWGARTLSRDPTWRYVSVRRLFLTLRRWVDRRMAWAGFEPNTPLLWVRITRELSAYLDTLWTAGALVGATPADAYYVKCDAETNPPEVREAGQTVTEVGLAPAAPAEFIVMRIIHHIGVEPR